VARVSTCLIFPRSTEQAFEFYRGVFGGEFAGGMHRFADIPANPGQPPLAEADRDLVMHVELAILGGHALMGTDAPESTGVEVAPGNDVFINLEPDTRGETERLFAALAAGGTGGRAGAGHVLGRLLRQPDRSLRRAVDVQLRRQGLGASGRTGDELPLRGEPT
jgi:PhnB protein